MEVFIFILQIKPKNAGKAMSIALPYACLKQNTTRSNEYRMFPLIPSLQDLCMFYRDT